MQSEKDLSVCDKEKNFSLDKPLISALPLALLFLLDSYDLLLFLSFSISSSSTKIEIASLSLQFDSITFCSTELFYLLTGKALACLC